MNKLNLPVVFALALFSCNAGYSTIVWTNTAGGSWSDASGWNPNQVPGAGDDAAITNGGSYIVTLDTSPAVNSLTLGGGSGTQTLATAGNSLTLNNPSGVNKNGILLWAGGGIYGPLTVSTNGVVIGSAGNFEDLHGMLTNNGTIELTNATSLRCYGDLGGAMLINLPGGLVDFQDDSQLATAGYGNETVVNMGKVRKSGGSGISAIYSAFYNDGTLDVQTGEVDVYLGEGSGLFKAEAGATLNFVSSYELEGVITGAGTNLLSGGSFTGTNGVISGGTLTWIGGWIDSGSTLTIATNGVLLVTGAGIYHDLHGVLTNAGAIELTNSTAFRCYGDTGGGQLINLPGGLVDIQDDSSIYYAGYAGEEVDNQGTVRKSGGSGISPIYPAFNNSGTLDVLSGEVDIYSGEGGGIFKVKAGTTLNFLNNYTADSGAALTGGGTNVISGGIFALDGSSITTSNLVLAAGALAGSNAVVSSMWTWTGGQVNGTVAIATNGVLLATGGSYLALHGVLTNAGTIQLTNATYLQCYGDTGGGQLINLPGGLVDFQDDSSIQPVGYPSEEVVNQGTVRKSGGSGISYINLAFYNSGTLDVMSGTVQLSQGEGSGVFKAEAGATLNFVGSYELEGVITGAGTNLLSGGSLTGTNSVISGGTLTWIGGAIGSGSTLKIATNGVLLAMGGGYLGLHGVLTNAGTIQLTGATYLQCYGDTGGGQLINLPGGLVDFQDDSGIYNVGYPSEAVVNKGTVRKSGGTGTSYIYPAFYNTGTLDAQSGVISLNGSYDLAGGTLNFGLNSPTDFGQITLSGAPTLTGTLSANLNNGYIAIRGNSFPVLNYGSQSGNFGNFILPAREAWSTNYGATTFTLTVLNSAPTLPAQTNQVVNEETLLTVTNTATDLDLPPDTLSYIFLTFPTGAHISAAGIITWTPDESQGPSTNTFTTRVSDNGSPSMSATNSFTVVVNEVNVAPVLPVIANTNINELTTLTVTNTATDHDIPANPLTYVLTQAPGNAVIDTNGVITWTPTEAQGPSTNTFTTVITDTNVFAVNAKSLSATNSFTVVVNEVNVAPVLTVPVNTNINELATLTVTNNAADSDFPANPLTFSLVSPLTGMAINATNGVITWTPTEAQGPSTNTITVVVTDTNAFAVNAKSLSTTNTFSVIVNEVNVAPVLTVPVNTNINELATLTVTNTATDSDIPANPLTFSLVSPLTGMAINATNGVFTWTPTEAQGPSTNTITVVVTDTNIFAVNAQSLSTTNTFTVVVNEVNVAPVLGALSDTTVNPGQTVSFTATATDADIPANTLTFSLVSPPAGATINSASGLFNWRLPVALANTTNTVQVQVTDFNPWAVNSQHLSDTKSFKVVVNPLAPVVLTPTSLANGQFKFQVNGTAGPDYIIATSTNLSAWIDIFTNPSPSLPFQFTNAVTSTNRFFRARLSP